MDSLGPYVSDYWWVIVVPACLMVFVWIFRGRGLKLAFLLLSVGIVFIYFSTGTFYGVGTALNQIVSNVVRAIRQVGTSLL
jgi:hypothetical protein